MGNREESIVWGLKAAKIFGKPASDYVLELSMIDVAVHACEVLRRQGMETEVADLKQMLLNQIRVCVV